MKYTIDTPVADAITEAMTVATAHNERIKVIMKEVTKALKADGSLTTYELILRNRANMVELEQHYAIRREVFMEGILKYMANEGTIEEVPGRPTAGHWQMVLIRSTSPTSTNGDAVKALPEYNTSDKDLANYFPDQFSLREFQVCILEFLKENGGQAKFDDILVRFMHKDIGPASMVLQTPIEVLLEEAREMLNSILDSLEGVRLIDRTSTHTVKLVASESKHGVQMVTEVASQLCKEVDSTNTFDSKDFQRATEIIALQYVDEQIKAITEGTHHFITPGNPERIHWYRTVKEMIESHSFEFRLSKPRAYEPGVPRFVCQVQLVKTLKPMDVWHIQAAMELFYSVGY